MPTKCSVSGCENYYSKGLPFFDIPSPLKYKFSSEKAELSKKRRKLWLDAMGAINDSAATLRICSKHFVTGKPATLEDSTDVDWVPSLHMKLSSSARKKRRKESEDDDHKQSVTNKKLRSAKESISTPKLHKPNAYETKKYGKTEEKSKKKENTNIPKKIDLKKFLNCKVLLDGNIQCTTFKGTNGSGLTIAQKHGKFTSDNVTIKEAALNNTVLRIHLIREDLDDLKRNYETLRKNSPNRKRRKELKVSSFGRQIKRKSSFFEDSFVHTPLKRYLNYKTENIRKLRSSAEKTERYIRNRNVNEDKNTIVRNKHKSDHETVKNSPDNLSKTQNKVIRRNHKNKFKIKLFPKTSIKQVVNCGKVNLKSGDPLNLHDEILFLKNLITERQYETKSSYFLKFCPYRYPEDGTINYTFQKLVTDIKHMKLPAPSWKIKVIIKQGKISAVTFTNKLPLERCVAFSANSNRYKITIDNKSALLLGSPKHIHTSEDLEILLDIIQNIDSRNPMIFYK